MNVKDPIGDALGVSPTLSEQEHDVSNLPANTALVPNSTDLDVAKENLKGLAEKGKTALDEIMEVARLSQHPRAYEVVATLIGQLATVNRELGHLFKTGKDLGVSTPTESGNGNVTHQHLYVGSTAELMKIIEAQRGRKGN